MKKKKPTKRSIQQDVIKLLTMHNDIINGTLEGNIEVYTQLLAALPKEDKSTKKMLEMSLRINQNTLKLIL